MPIAVADASQCVLETTPNVPRISGRVVKGGVDAGADIDERRSSVPSDGITPANV
jgi:hypothetical protein